MMYREYDGVLDWIGDWWLLRLLLLLLLAFSRARASVRSGHGILSRPLKPISVLRLGCGLFHVDHLLEWAS